MPAIRTDFRGAYSGIGQTLGQGIASAGKAVGEGIARAPKEKRETEKHKYTMEALMEKADKAKTDKSALEEMRGIVADDWKASFGDKVSASEMDRSLTQIGQMDIDTLGRLAYNVNAVSERKQRWDEDPKLKGSNLSKMVPKADAYLYSQEGFLSKLDEGYDGAAKKFNEKGFIGVAQDIKQKEKPADFEAFSGAMLDQGYLLDKDRTAQLKNVWESRGDIAGRALDQEKLGVERGRLGVAQTKERRMREQPGGKPFDNRVEYGKVKSEFNKITQGFTADEFAEPEQESKIVKNLLTQSLMRKDTSLQWQKADAEADNLAAQMDNSQIDEILKSLNVRKDKDDIVTVEPKESAWQKISKIVESLKAKAKGVAPPPGGRLSVGRSDVVAGPAPQPQQAPAPAPQAGQPVQISTDAEYEALPSGTEFVDPSGTRRRKP